MSTLFLDGAAEREIAELRRELAALQQRCAERCGELKQRLQIAREQRTEADRERDAFRRDLVAEKQAHAETREQLEQERLGRLEFGERIVELKRELAQEKQRSNAFVESVAQVQD